MCAIIVCAGAVAAAAAAAAAAVAIGAVDVAEGTEHLAAGYSDVRAVAGAGAVAGLHGCYQVVSAAPARTTGSEAWPMMVALVAAVEVVEGGERGEGVWQGLGAAVLAEAGVAKRWWRETVGC